MEVGTEFQDRIASWDIMFRWEWSELGRDLRRLGLSYGEIMDLIPVKKSTLATWCREVKLTEDQNESIKTRMHGSRVGIPLDTQWKRRLEIEAIRRRAQSQVQELVRDPLWVAGTILYWAEGTKGPHQVAVANTDPRTHHLFTSGSADISRWMPSFGCICISMKGMTMTQEGPIGGRSAVVRLGFPQDIHQTARHWASKEHTRQVSARCA